jgi:hypothetical protein
MLGGGVIIDNKKERISLKIKGVSLKTKANFLIHVIFWEKKDWHAITRRQLTNGFTQGEIQIKGTVDRTVRFRVSH